MAQQGCGDEKVDNRFMNQLFRSPTNKSLNHLSIFIFLIKITIPLAGTEEQLKRGNKVVVGPIPFNPSSLEAGYWYVSPILYIQNQPIY